MDDSAAVRGAAVASAPGRPLVRLRGVGKRFGSGVLALDGFDLDIAEHEFLSLLGPSGCGKSTALRLIAGLGAATAGAIEWSAAHGRGDIGFVFQEPTLMPWATVFDNVYLPLRLQGRGRGAARAEVEAAIGMVGLGGFEKAYPRELSGGMKMRVSIARALATRPRLLLMDEPFAALDEITRQKLNNDLLALKAATGCTVIFVTHSVFESVFLSDRILVMAPRPGRVMRELTVEAPYPRDMAFRTSADYAAHARAASDALMAAMGGELMEEHA